MKNDAIIFDIDGTLWNACPAVAKGWSEGFQALGISRKITAKEIKKVAGNPYEKCLEILLPGSLEKYPTLLEIVSFYDEQSVKSKGGVFYKGVLDGIPQLSKDYHIFLVSNCQEWYLKLFLQFSNLRKYLKDVDCNGISQLPKQEMIINIKNKYSLKNPIYIGDTAGDENASKLAGVDFVHVSYGFGQPENNCLSFSTFSNLVNHFNI